MKHALFAAVLLALAACGSSQHAIVNGASAPAWSDPVATGGTLSSSALQGAPVYLNFFASWCPPCNVETPWIEAFSREFAARGLRIVGVDMEENAPTALRFRAKYGITYPVLVDSGTLQTLYNINGLPVHVFIKRDGTISHIVVGEMSKREIETDIRTIVAGS